MRDLNEMKDEALHLLSKGIAIYIKLEDGKNISVFPPTSNSNIYKSSLEIWDGHDWELIMNFTPKEDPKELIDALFVVFEKEIRRIKC